MQLDAVLVKLNRFLTKVRYLAQRSYRRSFMFLGAVVQTHMKDGHQAIKESRFTCKVGEIRFFPDQI